MGSFRGSPEGKTNGRGGNARFFCEPLLRALSVRDYEWALLIQQVVQFERVKVLKCNYTYSTFVASIRSLHNVVNSSSSQKRDADLAFDYFRCEPRQIVSNVSEPSMVPAYHNVSNFCKANAVRQCAESMGNEDSLAPEAEG